MTRGCRGADDTATMAAKARDDNFGRAAPGRLVILYDGGCDMCRSMVRAVREFDKAGVIEALDLHDEQARRRFPNLETGRLMIELHAIDDRGNVFRGARAINEILRRQHGPVGMLAWLWYLPGYAWLADRQYRRIAGSRRKFSSHPAMDAQNPAE
ncbi:MAG: thiol-disulfide oxidoreductase DCC family protein [Candidatus Binataceae bacterium]